MTKKKNIVEAAVRLFARQGFDGTTTLQIANSAEVTEPLIYYHFEGKNELFTYIIDSIFTALFSRFDLLDKKTDTEFKKIQNYISVLFQFVREKPDELFLILSSCPAKLNDPDHICAENAQSLFERGIDYLGTCLKNGIQSGEFNDVPVEQTASAILAMLHGLVRFHAFDYGNDITDMKDTVIEFCRRSLVK